MELWIRRQDKECLMKVDRLDYDLQNNEHRIMVNGYQKLVAKYETKERALEVLDEIQYYIQNQGKTFAVPNENGIIIDYKYCGSVYEMPKE